MAPRPIPRGEIAPSLLACDFSRLAQQIELVMDAGANVLHFDSMDGKFVPPSTIGSLIAASIFYMALENIVSPGLRRRWLLAFGFGLVHGFGFSFALRDTMQLAGSHLLTSLLSFNVGVEFGQLAVLAVLVPALTLFFRFVVAERMGTIVLSAIVAHTGWPAAVLGTVENYRTSTAVYSFPTTAATVAALAPHLVPVARHPQPYELGDRCPTLVLRRAG